MEENKKKKLKENDCEENDNDQKDDISDIPNGIDLGNGYVLVNREDLIIEDEFPSWFEDWLNDEWESPDVKYFDGKSIKSVKQLHESLEKKTSDLDTEKEEKNE